VAAEIERHFGYVRAAKQIQMSVREVRLVNTRKESQWARRKG